MAAFIPIQGQLNGLKSTYETTLGDGESEIIKAPAIPCSISIIPGANTGNMEYTFSSESAIDGASAIWFSGFSGAGANARDSVVAPVSAIRLSASGGDVKFEVVS